MYPEEQMADQEAPAAANQEGFDVNDTTEVEDMTDVKEQRVLTPVAQDVLFVVNNLSIDRVLVNNQSTESPENPCHRKSLKAELRIVEGIPVVDPATGQTEMKYKGKPLWVQGLDLTFWADMNHVADSGKNAGKKRADIDWWKNKQHLIGFKQFVQALGLPLQGLKVNDEFCSENKGKFIRASIRHEETQVKGPDGKYQGSGNLRERVTGFKSGEEQIAE